MIKAIIFDMDGTLVDTEPFNTEIEKRQFSLRQIAISDEEHRQYMGISSEIMWRIIAERHMLIVPGEELIEQNRMESLRYFAELDEIPIMPGLIDLLENLQAKNYPLAVASSSCPEIIDLILKKTGLRDYFQIVVSTQEAGKSKPEPDVFLLAARKLGVKPEHSLVIEDSANGIRAAHAAEMSCVAFQGPGADPQSQKEADAIVGSYAQLGMMLRAVGTTC
ncbi:MAG TPA: HAD family phosphatase [Prolixibacteraceae bacterium]|nr:HAD family phosphatase [Prolixibacteraceae bacterium]